ncbi:malate dehydrogenase [Dacryopinax primogenitus]|uniref:Malic enzyme n=1 Tax=Dacryopinax primogenitus (strain DJM 731) TaxID=1858805 RepID=M5FTR1_DACPD|nr:malate dehydrogenase [Dacryopinax primogenitus]EJU01041.1 malate dehydrogenase [Dacryopinax primogenitus]
MIRGLGKLRESTARRLARCVSSESATSETKNLVPAQTNLRGESLLNNPRLNKGAAFSREERAIFGLEGFLPYDVHTIEQQVQRVLSQIDKQNTPLLKHVFLASLRDQNQVLFYRVMQEHLKDFLGILYTPTAGEAIQSYSRLFRRASGCFISFPNADGMRAQLEAHVDAIDNKPDVNDAAPGPIDLVVVTDSESILGIGDQGVGGVTISTSKSALYTLGAGFNPNRLLPVVLDVGTDRYELFSDPLYMGWKHTRVRGEPYNQFVHKFIKNCSELFPGALIHFEDFGPNNAYRLLEKYRDKVPCFNDDIQGTGAVALAALISAGIITKTKLSQQRIVLYGCGSAGLGIVNQIRDGMMMLDGVTKEAASRQFWCVDRNGLLLQSMGPNLRPGQMEYARPDHEVYDWPHEVEEQDALRLIDVIRAVKPTVLIGTSTHARGFTEQIVREMAHYVERPIIFPLSNPTSLCELDPLDAMHWTDYRALVATGSPFPPVPMSDGRLLKTAEANNALCFPALGLGTVISRSRTMSPGMIMAGVHALAQLSPVHDNPDSPGSLLPDLTDVRRVSVKVAAAVLMKAIEEGHSHKEFNFESEEDVEEYIKRRMWDPVYRPIEPADGEERRVSW